MPSPLPTGRQYQVRPIHNFDIRAGDFKQMVIVNTDSEIIDGFVYFVMNGVKPSECGEDWDKRSYVKIGYSKSPKERFSALQTASPERLDLMGYFPGNPDTEKQFHELFDHLRRKGEWFALTRQLYTCINQFELIKHHLEHKSGIIHDGLKSAKQRGEKRGRPRSLHRKTGVVLKERRNGLGVRAIARKLQMAPSSVHKILNPAHGFGPKITWKLK